MPVFILRSSGLSIPNDGEWFTSKSVGLSASSRMMSKPRISKQRESRASPSLGALRGATASPAYKSAYELERPTAPPRWSRSFPEPGAPLLGPFVTAEWYTCARCG